MSQDRSEYHALYHSIHAEQRAQTARGWRERNAERVRAYREENGPQRRAQSRAQSYRRRVAAHLGEPETVWGLWATFNLRALGSPIQAHALVSHWTQADIANQCSRGCGRAWREIIHKVPLYAGGTHDVTNLVPVCGRCA